MADSIGPEDGTGDAAWIEFFFALYAPTTMLGYVFTAKAKGLEVEVWSTGFSLLWVAQPKGCTSNLLRFGRGSAAPRLSVASANICVRSWVPAGLPYEEASLG